MRFLARVLPTILLILLIAVIYFGGKKVVTFVNNNSEAYEAYRVTKNAENEHDNETSYQEESLADVSNFKKITPKEKQNKRQKINDEDSTSDESDFDEDFEDADVDSPEASLDAELEGKSSNQLIASKTEKKSKIEKKSTSKSTNTKKSVAQKTNKKPSADKLTTKGIKRDVPTSYDVKSTGEQFMVIAGSFKSKDNANIFIDDLEKKGLRNIEIIEMKNKSLNRVCVSRHATYEVAKEVTTQLRKKYNVEAYVHRKAN